MTPAGIVADFQPEYTRLTNVGLELTREDRRSDATVIAKGDAKTYYDQQFRWIAGCLAMLYHLAGRHELAERIKPSPRRAGRTQADVEAERAERQAENAEREAEKTEREADNAEDSAESPDVPTEESETVEAEAIG
jgi:hypothetical protein